MDDKPLQHPIRSFGLFLPEELLRFPCSVISRRHRCSSLANWKIYSHSGCKLHNTCREREYLMSQWCIEMQVSFITQLIHSSDTKITINCGCCPDPLYRQREHVHMCACSNRRRNVILIPLQKNMTSDCISTKVTFLLFQWTVIMPYCGYWKLTLIKNSLPFKKYTAFHFNSVFLLAVNEVAVVKNHSNICMHTNMYICMQEHLKC